jgi:hypothetical protein
VKAVNVLYYTACHTNARNLLQLNCVYAFLHGNSLRYTEPRSRIKYEEEAEDEESVE